MPGQPGCHIRFETAIATELKRCTDSVSRISQASSPGEQAVGGLISVFEAVRTATCPSAHRWR